MKQSRRIPSIPNQLSRRNTTISLIIFAREAVAAGTIRVTKEDGKTNLADVLTKLLPQATKDFLCDRLLY
jgi:hypothetical protein